MADANASCPTVPDEPTTPAKPSTPRDLRVNIIKEEAKKPSQEQADAPQNRPLARAARKILDDDPQVPS